MAPWAAMWLILMMFFLEAWSVQPKCALESSWTSHLLQGSEPLFLLMLPAFDLQGTR